MIWSISDLIKIADIFGGVAILNTDQNTPLSFAGLRYGDIVLKLNDKETHDPNSLMSALNSIKTNLSIEYIRNGNVIVFCKDVNRKDFKNLHGVIVGYSEEEIYDSTNEV